MKRLMVSLAVVLTSTSQLLAWNDLGHMVVARIAWNELKPEERAKVIALLEKHPYYDEFLKSHRPLNIPENDWVFLRAATWADWIKQGPPSRQKYSDKPAHYIDTPYVQGNGDFQPPPLSDVNILTKMKDETLRAKTGNQEDRAVAITWLMHLTGDIHQPLHCVSLYSKDVFPQGDRGGNNALIRIDGRTTHLHPFWDGLLGKATTLSSIQRNVHEVNTILTTNEAAVKTALDSHKTPKEWAKESYDFAKSYAYGYHGKELAPANAHDDPPEDAIPSVAQDYAEEAGDVARLCVGKAGKRLAQVLRDILAAE
jgi:hypothetical protein